MTDQTTKFLLAAIALGLWMNVAEQWFRPVALQAQDDSRIVNELRSIASDVDSLERIARGTCSNSKIC